MIPVFLFRGCFAALRISTCGAMWTYSDCCTSIRSRWCVRQYLFLHLGHVLNTREFCKNQCRETHVVSTGGHNRQTLASLS